MSKREWAGLVVHAFSLMILTKQVLKVGKDFTGGDGVLVRVNDDGSNDGVYVEQTLATHKVRSDLTTAIRSALMAKSSKDDNYALNKHLIIWCNINGDFDSEAIAKIAPTGAFNIVNVIGFNGERLAYLSLVFDKDVTDKPIHRFGVHEKDLVS